MAKLGIGIIGAGGIAGAHAKAYADCDLAQIVGFADLNPAAAESAAGRYNVKAMDVESLLNDPNIQAVSVCTPPTSHADLAIEVLEAGKHVLIEKPVCTTLADAQRIMSSTATSGGLKAMVAHSHRFWSTNQRAREIIASGEIGEIVMARDEILSTAKREPNAPLPWRFKKAVAGGGVVMDNGVHAVDRLRYWLGLNATDVDARMWTVVPGADVEDAAVANVHFGDASAPHGTAPTAQIYLNRTVPKATGRCVAEFLGTKGSLVVDTWKEVRWCSEDGEWNVEAVKRPPTAFDNEIRAFLGSIQDDTPVPISAEDGTESLRVVLAMYESAERNTRIAV